MFGSYDLPPDILAVKSDLEDDDSGVDVSTTSGNVCIEAEPENRLMAELFFLSSLPTALKYVLRVVTLEPG